jgi:hypothetical protein
MQEEQKKFQEEILPKLPRLGWDPLGSAHKCIENIKKSIGTCDVINVIAGTGCAFGNIEAAFYEKQISEDEMNSIKDNADILRSEFTKKCKCINR